MVCFFFFFFCNIIVCAVSRIIGVLNDVWMTCKTFRVFSAISVISRQWKGDTERCATEFRLRLSPAGLEPRLLF